LQPAFSYGAGCLLATTHGCAELRKNAFASGSGPPACQGVALGYGLAAPSGLKPEQLLPAAPTGRPERSPGQRPGRAGWEFLRKADARRGPRRGSFPRRHVLDRLRHTGAADQPGDAKQVDDSGPQTIVDAVVRLPLGTRPMVYRDR